MKKNVFLSIISFLAIFASTVGGIALCVYDMINGSPTWINVVGIVMYVLVDAYFLCDYKRPHTNLMRYLFLTFALYIAVTSFREAAFYSDGYGPALRNLSVSLLCISVSFMAGRLHKMKQNFVWIFVATVCLIVKGIAGIMIWTALGHPVESMGAYEYFEIFSDFTIWVPMIIAYIYRYKAHIDAGLMDTPEK